MRKGPRNVRVFRPVKSARIAQDGAVGDFMPDGGAGIKEADSPPYPAWL